MVTRPPRARHRCAPGVLLLLLWAPPLAAADPLPPLPPFEAAEGERKHDWLQLQSGEWLRGEMSRMYERKLYFDSKEFGDITLDWGDVSSLILSAPVTIRLPKGRILTGDFEMRNRNIRLESQGGVVEVPAADLISLAAGGQRERRYWSGSASVSLSARSGNAEQFDLSLRAALTRHTTLTRSTASYTGAISSSSGIDTARSHRVPAAFDVFLTDRFFWKVLGFEYYTDAFQNIDRRFTLGSGLGYDLYSSPRVSWEVSGGLAYQNTAHDDVSAEVPAANDLALTFSTEVEFKLPRGIDWETDYALQVVATDIGKTSHHLESVLSLEIWGPLDVEAAFIFDRVEKPVPKAGAEVQSNDYRLTFGLGIEY